MRSLLPAALFAALSTSALAEITLHDAFERAVARNPDAQVLKARIEEARAREFAARSFTPAPPAVIVGTRRDNTLVDRQLGKSEYEAEIEVPFWLPGQRAATSASARAQEGSFRLGSEAVAWSVAGVVRELVWTMAVEAAEMAVARRRVDTTATIESDVAKRLKGGEIAKGDLLQAQSEVLAARAALADAELRYRRSVAAWTAVTGLQTRPDQYEETPVATVDPDRHPRLIAASASVAAARAELGVVTEFRRDPPSLSLQNRTDRDVTDGDYRNTLRLNVRIPFATEARNRPRIASAQALLTHALVFEQRERALVAADIDTATVGREVANTQLELARVRDVGAREALRLARRGFTLGETPFVLVLLALARSIESDLALARADIGVKLSYARYNQAAGVLP